MKKLYYDNQGWVCNRYPYDIPQENAIDFLEVDEETYEKTFTAEVGKAWRVTNSTLVLDIFDQAEYNSVLLQLEHSELIAWFNKDYTHYEQKYRRLATLGKLCDDGTAAETSLIQLYELAETKRKRIQEIEAQLTL